MKKAYRNTEGNVWVVEIVAAAKGWTTIQFDDGTQKKVRPSTLEEIAVEEPVAEIEETEPAAELEPIELTCPECEHIFLLKRPKLSVQCPKCGAWIQVRIKADLTHYVRGLGVTPSGHDTLDIGDETADIFRGLTAGDAIHVAAGRLIRIGQANMTRGFRKAYNGHTGGAWNLEAMVSYLQDRYGSRNNGMVRMNCGNLVRAAARRAAEQI